MKMRNGRHVLVEPLQYLFFMTATSKKCGDKKINNLTAAAIERLYNCCQVLSYMQAHNDSVVALMSV